MPNPSSESVTTTGIDGKEPLVVLELGFSYGELCGLTQQISQATSIEVPLEIIDKISSFFVVERVNSSSVQVVRASSSNEQHPLSAALDPSESNWWISGPDSMPGGRGREFVEFQLSTKICRLQQFSIQIPPLPMGPLSVRQLRLEKYQPPQHEDEHPHPPGNPWIPISPIWTVENKTGWQTFTLDPPVDVQLVRVLCLSNQISMIIEQMENANLVEEDPMNLHLWSVGFYCVKFT